MITPEECDLYVYEKRLQTYSGWPFTGGCVCTPENMAKAGFIHCPTENSPDVVQCFFCYKELEGWEPEDDPLQEHKRHSPNCTFIGLKKNVEDMTLVELLKLQKDRQKFLLKKSTDENMEKFRQAAQKTRSELVKIITKAN
ncbi:baculoviral IAP repeat-containing protein 5a [Polypterus senegalus]|uniref:baculoviral IAP repeat-containing protein 5a n=1 Tax=Polypterus senegalus TaxID=55291 RepID=UPI0019657392|nr:baculoviral IAP repeat-containing protein 5a [Polypterus senegalus]